MATTSAGAMGAQTTQADNSAIENATDRRPPIHAITAGAYKALTKAPVPHPAFSQP